MPRRRHRRVNDHSIDTIRRYYISGLDAGRQSDRYVSLAVLPPVRLGADEVSIAVYESTSHSFIVRIWIEEPAARGRRAVWRGQITHVGDGERRTVQRLTEVVDFIASYLSRMGVSESRIWRLIRCLRG